MSDIIRYQRPVDLYIINYQRRTTNTWSADLREWRWRDVAGDVVEVDVSSQQLPLPERLVTVVARVRFFARVRQDVRLEVALIKRRVRTQLAAEALLTVVCLQVNLPTDT